MVDKSSTDDTPAIAAQHADRVITVPWSPTVEETRAFAVAQCTHDWIICLDDDECLSIEAIRFIQAELAAPRADVYGLLQRHYILGTHDEAAYYWPEHQIRIVSPRGRDVQRHGARRYRCCTPIAYCRWLQTQAWPSTISRIRTWRSGSRRPIAILHASIVNG